MKTMTNKIGIMEFYKPNKLKIILFFSITLILLIFFLIVYF